MLRRKQILSLILAASLAAALSGCQSASTDSQTAAETTAAVQISEAAGAADPEETAETEETQGKSTEKKMTPWFNSNVAGTVGEGTEAELKDDFYLATNRDYLKNATIKEGWSNANSFVDVQEILNERMGKLMTDPAIEGHDAQLIREFYAMWLDWDTRNQLGMSVLTPHMEAIEQLETLEDMSRYLASEEGVFYGASLSSISLGSDMEDSRWYCVEIGSPSLFLGDSDEYEKLTSVGERYLNAYREKAGLMLDRAGYQKEEADKEIENAYALEEELAGSILSTADTHQPDFIERIQNKVTLEELAELSPNYPLVEILKTMGFADSERINLSEPEWLARLNQLYTEENFQMIKSYLIVRTLMDYGRDLDEDTYRKIIEINNGIHGIKGSLPDEELALADTNRYLNTCVSKVYAQEYLSEEIRDDITQIIRESIAVYRNMLEKEEWLSEETREKAIEKLENIRINAVYPDKWEDMEGLSITPAKDGGNYFQALIEIGRYYMELQRKRVNTRVDKEEWATGMGITEVNAYYAPWDNSINIIGGILGGAFYNPEMSQEEKLACIGMVIGHEISHAFDDQGSQYDKDGNVKDWWTQEDYDAFGARAQKLIDYYDTIVPFDGGENYPGINVQGEAIADITGLKCMLLLAKETEDFDYDKFFRAYSAMWRSVATRERCELQAYQDSHPLDYLRVNVTLMQQPEFYDTYGIKGGDGMYMDEADRFPVW